MTIGVVVLGAGATVYAAPDSAPPPVVIPVIGMPNPSALAAYLQTEAAASCKPPESVDFNWTIYPISQDDHGNTVEVDVATRLKRVTGDGCGTFVGTMTAFADLRGESWTAGDPQAGVPPTPYSDHVYDDPTEDIVIGDVTAHATFFDWPDWPADYPNDGEFTGRLRIGFDFTWNYGDEMIAYSPTFGTAIGATCTATRPDTGTGQCAFTEYQTDPSGVDPG